MNGRVYDPELGRFTSADPFVQFPFSTQGLNRYTYVNNNPLLFTDPSGYSIFDKWGKKTKKFLKKNRISRKGIQRYARGSLKYGLVFGNPNVQRYVANHRWAQTVIQFGVTAVGTVLGGPAGAAAPARAPG